MARARKQVAVLGAGPIGIEAALYAAHVGHRVDVYERGRVGHNVLDWGHVRLFSSWALDRSALGIETLREVGCECAPGDLYPTGTEYVERYLVPLARSPRLDGRIHERHAVRHIGRDRIGKADLVGGPRERYPFRLLLDTPSGERLVHADVVLDCTGTYGIANWTGSGNVPALGERALGSRIDRTLVDVAGSERARFANRRVLVVGSGHSAATALEALLQLEGVAVDWVVRRETSEPMPVVPDDPLPERERLSRMANRLARGADPRVACHAGTVVEAIEDRDRALEITLSTGDRSHTVLVDRVLSLVGYHPDGSIHGELQVHECYASGGPMKLAATLAAGTADCLAQTSAGPESLRNPEPGFFMLGAKSYGRHSSFLIRIGIEQIREVFTLIEARPELNLYDRPGTPAG